MTTDETDWPDLEADDLQVILDLAHTARRISSSVRIVKYLTDHLTDEMHFRRDLRVKHEECVNWAAMTDSQLADAWRETMWLIEIAKQRSPAVTRLLESLAAQAVVHVMRRMG